jgi:hypothetical protein
MFRTLTSKRRDAALMVSGGVLYAASVSWYRTYWPLLLKDNVRQALTYLFFVIDLGRIKLRTRSVDL